MGTITRSSLFLNGSPNEVGQWVVRLMRAKGFQLVYQEPRVEIDQLNVLFDQSPEPSRYIIAWMQAGEGWCLVVGLEDADPQGNAVRASELIALSGRNAINLGFIDEIWWCQYYVEGVIEEEWGNLGDRPMPLWEVLVNGDPSGDGWVKARALAAARGRGLATQADVISLLREKVEYRKHASLGLLETSDLVRQPYRGQLELDKYASNKAEFFTVFEEAIRLRYIMNIDLTVMEQNRQLVSQFPNYVDAFKMGVSGAVFIHPALAKGQVGR